MASKTSNKHWSKVNSTYRLKVGNKESEKFEERKIDQIFFMIDILQKKIYIISKNLIFVTTSKSPQHL